MNSFSVSASRRLRSSDRTYRGRLTKKLLNQLNDTWDYAIVKFYEQLADLPVDTGMSVGSVIPIGRLVMNHKSKAMQIEALLRARVAANGSVSKSSSTNQQGMPPNGGRKSVGAGINAAIVNYKAATPESPTFKFNFTVNVFQMFLGLNGHHIPTSGDWDALRYAQIAFDEIMSVAMENREFSRIARSGSL